MADILNDDFVNDLLAGAGAKGQYGIEFNAFVNSGVRGVKVDLETGTFAGKKPTSVRSSFEIARKKYGEKSEENKAVADAIRVIAKDEQVYLINTAVSAG